jgi:hypothetical protein
LGPCAHGYEGFDASLRDRLAGGLPHASLEDVPGRRTVAFLLVPHTAGTSGSVLKARFADIVLVSGLEVWWFLFLWLKP